jgi:hypothetical protein
MTLLRSLTSLIAFGLLTSSAHASDPVSSLSVDASGALPAGLSLKQIHPKLDEKANNAVLRVMSWTGVSGERVAVFLTSSKKGQKHDTVHESRTLYVTTFAKKGLAFEKVEDIMEYVAPCALDLIATFFDKSIGLTDLDGDGEGELTFAYSVGCGGDVSPTTMKLIMLEGKTKYALRGVTRVDPGTGTRMGGDYKADFKKAPESFLAHAKKVWEANADTN